MSRFTLEIPVIGILRGIEKEFFAGLLESVFGAGLQATEVTMNTRGALSMLRENRKRVYGNKFLGMGTICNVDEARQAIDAGAMFLVTPNLDEEVIRYANDHAVPVVCGALTPTEVYRAWNAGAAMIKVFPCKAMGGPRYIKDLRGPYDEIPLAAVGGVTLDNLSDYFEAGVQAVGVSTSLFGKKALAERDLHLVNENVTEFLDLLPSV